MPGACTSVSQLTRMRVPLVENRLDDSQLNLDALTTLAVSIPMLRVDQNTERASRPLTPDLDQFAQLGGVAGFFVENGSLRFAFNLDSAKRRVPAELEAPRRQG
jgi:hypothetical protein